jgi:selenocysteine-specific translation elongation factor
MGIVSATSQKLFDRRSMVRCFRILDSMGNIIVAVLGAPEYSANLGKKSTSSDITLYDLKKGEEIVTLVEPTKYPERLAPLFFAVSEASMAIIVVDELNASFGECVLMLQCSGVKSGYIILRNYLTREKVEPIIKGTVLERFEFVLDDPALLREALLNKAAQEEVSAGSLSFGTVPVDHAFNVKGVGTVALGVVVNGIIQKHEDMRVLPGNMTAQIRSIQKHDDDFESASRGDRVGLALRNVEVEDVERGVVLTSDPSIKSSTSIKARVSLVNYWPSPLKSGMVLHLGHWMQFIICRVESVSDDGDWHQPILSLALEKELIHISGDQAVLTYLEGGRLRVVGTVRMP